MTNQAALVMTTIDSRSKAEHLSELMVSDGLCACAQISDKISSIFIWKGKIQNEQEYLISFKTLSGKVDMLMEAIRSSHPYETPEIIALSIDRVDEDYLQWMESVLD